MTPLDASIEEVVSAVCSGAVHPRDLVEECLERISEHESLEAWTNVDADGARRQSDDLHVRIRRARERGDPRSTIGPLAGVPMGIKDIFDVRGLPTGGGVAHKDSPRHTRVAPRDSSVVARLRAADAIILGKTVTTELACFDPAATVNPWNDQATPGGSSSGSAAALAVGMCWATIGSQTGGSISRPAAYCGVCGLKPRFQQLPMDGVIPVSRHLDHPGPLARSVADLRQVWLALQGTHSPPPNAATSTLDGMKLAVLESSSDFWRMDSGQDVFQAAIDKLGNLPTVQLDFDWERLRDHHQCIMAVDGAATHRSEFETNPERFSPNIAGMIKQGLATPAWRYADALVAQERFRAEFARAIAPWDAVLTPAATGPAPGRESTGDPRMNCLWSLSGLATVTLPCGWFGAVRPLPIALQLGSSRAETPLLLAAAGVERVVQFQRRQFA